MIPIDTGELTTEIITQLALWFEMASSGILQSASQWMIDFGNGFFYVALKICTGFITSTPQEMAPEAWTAMKEFAQGSAAIGIAEDLVIVFFLISLVDYAISIRNHVEPEDIMKMFGRAMLAQLLVFNFMDILEGLWKVCSSVVTIIAPSGDQELLGEVGLIFGVIPNLLMGILALVYMIVMIMLSFKIITTFWEKYLWAFLMLPFGAPAFAVVVGTGQWNATTRAYIKFLVSLICEFIAMALLMVLLGKVSSAFRETLMTWLVEGTGIEENYFLSLVVGYMSNICFAGMASGLITKLDGQVNKMLAL